MTFRRLISLLFATLILGALTVAAQSVKERQARKDRLEKEIAVLDRQIRDNASKNADADARLSLLKAKISSRQALVNESDAQLKLLDARVAAKQKEIDIQQARLDTMTAYCSRLVRSAYKNRDARIWYMYILSSDNVSQGLRRAGFFKNLSSRMSDEAVRVKEAKAALEAERAVLDSLSADARAVRAVRMKELQSLRSEEKDAKALADKLKKQKSKYQKDLAAKKRQADALEREIRAAIGKSSGKSSGKGGKKSTKPIDYKLSDEFASNKGKLPWPVEGAITGRFGTQYHSVFKNLQLPSNNGINIAVSPGTDVKAVFNGVVAQISVLPGYHQCILVQHGKYFTLYSKVGKVYVKTGDKVTTGQSLGTVDTIGGETVLHFEIWNDHTVPRDPETWLRPR